MGRPQEFDVQKAIASAMAVYWERGLHRASIDEIVRATGLARSSLYNSFGSKEGLFSEAVRLYVDHQVTRFQRIVSESSFESVLTQLFQGPVGDNFEGRGCLLGNCASSLMSDEVEHQKMILAGFERIFSILEKRIRQAQDDGEMDVALEADAAAILVCSTISGMRLFRKTGMSSTRMKKAARPAIESLLLRFGIAPKTY